jgi:Zinc carboxypeptidase
MKTFTISTLLLITLNLTLMGQNLPLTIAEKSGYKSTSTYSEVMDFIKDVTREGSCSRVEYFAATVYGKKLPLLVIADPLPQCPAELRNDSRIVVYIQANIHAGEVEGKEASLMLLRDLQRTEYSKILKDVVVLITPILNADGNDWISRENRPHQKGPINGVGTRFNGQHLDLNRDSMKLESPEIRGVVQNILKRWDPAVIVDCHTTNGSYHEEAVTFSWIMNPNSDAGIRNFMRDRMMPVIRDRLRYEYKTDNCFYGNFVDNLKPEKGWIFHAASPRYITNYIGLRNRLAILNENYVYADYKSRVLGAYHLLKSILDYAAENKELIKDEIAAADRRTIEKGSNPGGSRIALEYEPAPTPRKVTIKSYVVEEYPGLDGRKRFRPTSIKKTVTVPYLADYRATSEAVLPFAYILSYPDKNVLENLEKHGITIEKLYEDIELEVEQFRIDKITGEPRLNQGHRNTVVKGEFETTKKSFPAGTWVVRTGQKLGNLAAYLLEPETDDGLSYWNFFDKYLAPQWGKNYSPYPVYKLMKKTELPIAKD